ncbi:hypothetical protein BH11PSE10_BH11PSE10_14560 [soil metagenome]
MAGLRHRRLCAENGFEMLRHLASAGPHRPRFLLATSNHSLDELRSMGSLPPDVTLMPKPLEQNGFVAWLTSRLPDGVLRQTRERVA